MKANTAAKIAALIVSLFAVSCNEESATTEESSSKILQKIEGAQEIGCNFVIRSIDQKGNVLLGTWSMSPTDCYRYALTYKKPIYRLEGKAMINDPVVIIAHYEDQVLEGGQVRRVVTKWGVRSKNNKEYESHFSQTPKDEEKHP